MKQVKRLVRRVQRRFPDEYAIVFRWHRSTRFYEAFEQTRSIFIHVPKTAGQSVAMALYNRGIAHMSWREWYQRNPRKFASYFKFAVLRDPIARFCSAFDFLKAGGMLQQDKEFAGRVLQRFATVNDLASALADVELQEQVMHWWHFRPQAYFVADEFGRSKMDLLIPLENLQTGVNEVARKLKLNRPIEIPYLNQTPIRHSEELNDHGRRVLRKLYQQDFALRDLALLPRLILILSLVLDWAEWLQVGDVFPNGCSM